MVHELWTKKLCLRGSTLEWSIYFVLSHIKVCHVKFRTSKISEISRYTLVLPPIVLSSASLSIRILVLGCLKESLESIFCKIDCSRIISNSYSLKSQKSQHVSSPRQPRYKKNAPRSIYGVHSVSFTDKCIIFLKFWKIKKMKNFALPRCPFSRWNFIKIISKKLCS